MLATKHHAYVTEGIDGQVVMDQAQKRLHRDGEETTIHYHPHGVACDFHNHTQVLSKEGY
jgi:hypothetical protein